MYKKSLIGNLMSLLHSQKIIALCLCATSPKIVAKLYWQELLLIRSC